MIPVVSIYLETLWDRICKGIKFYTLPVIEQNFFLPQIVKNDEAISIYLLAGHVGLNILLSFDIGHISKSRFEF
jgi:hypothetical protein